VVSSDGFGTRSTTLQFACRAERVGRIFGEKRQSGAVFLDAAEAFGSIRIKEPVATFVF
jgi:hypothetical protein